MGTLDATGGAGLGGTGLGGTGLGGTALGGTALGSAALDGNAIGGLLIEVFGTEMTTATSTCGHCGAVSEVAELSVYRPGLGTVVRCRGCDGVLMVFVQRRDVTCVDLQGLASLTAA